MKQEVVIVEKLLIECDLVYIRTRIVDGEMEKVVLACRGEGEVWHSWCMRGGELLLEDLCNAAGEMLKMVQEREVK